MFNFPFFHLLMWERCTRKWSPILYYYNLVLSCEYQCILLTSGDVRRKLNTNSDITVLAFTIRKCSLSRKHLRAVSTITRWKDLPNILIGQIAKFVAIKQKLLENNITLYHFEILIQTLDRRPKTFKRNYVYSAIKLEIWKKWIAENNILLPWNIPRNDQKPKSQIEF